MLEYMEKNCPICGSKSSLLYADVPDYQYPTAYRSNYSRCESCLHIFCPDSLSDLDISRFYADYTTHAPVRGGGGIVSVIRAISFVFSLGLFKRGGGDFSVETLRNMPEGSLLDVGCGAGGFLLAMKRLGWKSISGIDQDPKAVDACMSQGISDVRVGDVYSAAGTYSYVSMNHVIEHLQHPHLVVKEIYRLLGKSGMVVLRTPNSASFLSKIFGRYWRGLESPRHLNVYSPKSLRMLFGVNSWECQVISSDNELLFSVYLESALALFREVGTSKALAKVLVLATFPALVSIVAFLSLFNSFCADELVAVFRKKE